MRIIQPGYEILKLDPYDLPLVERAARVCYKSEGSTKEGSAEQIVKRLIASDHGAMLEHGHVTVLFTVDRGISHELVRHRLASFAQESTRYANYANNKFGHEITVIEPAFYKDIPEEQKTMLRRMLDDVVPDNEAIPYDQITDLMRRYVRWYDACRDAEREYFNLIDLGAKPEEARNVLPTSLKTDIVVTANFREWRHILKLRALGTTGKPHPQMAQVMMPLLEELRQKAPEFFGDLT